LYFPARWQRSCSKLHLTLWILWRRCMRVCICWWFSEILCIVRSFILLRDKKFVLYSKKKFMKLFCST
jgi:hypothetical protein